jgi:hypothetical protein
VLAAHVTQPIPDARNYAPDLPDAVQDVIDGGMAKDPAQRYQSAGALSDALQAALRAPATYDGPRRPVEGGPIAVAAVAVAGQAESRGWSSTGSLIVPRAGPQARSARPAPVEPTPGPRRWVVAGIVALLVLLVAAGALALTQKPSGPGTASQPTDTPTPLAETSETPSAPTTPDGGGLPPLETPTDTATPDDSQVTAQPTDDAATPDLDMTATLNALQTQASILLTQTEQTLQRVTPTSFPTAIPPTITPTNFPTRIPTITPSRTPTSVPVVVIPPPTIVSFQCSPCMVANIGDSFTLGWATNNAQSVTLNGQAMPTSGSIGMTATGYTNIFTLIASNTSGVDTRTMSIRVAPTPTPTFTPTSTFTPTFTPTWTPTPPPPPPPPPNLISNPGFEAALSGWTFVPGSGSCSKALYTTQAGPAHGGSTYLAFAKSNDYPSCVSTRFTISRALSRGGKYTAAACLRSGGQNQTATLAIWGLGVTPIDGASAVVSIANGFWTCTQVTMTVQQAGQSTLRFEVYVSTMNVDVHVDDTGLYDGQVKIY